MIDVASLRAFVAVAEHGSFSRAGDSLFLSQSAVSKRVSALEEDIAARLLDRIGRSVHLTEAGEVFLPRARRVLAELDTARQAVVDLGGVVGGRLRIATSHHIGLHRLPPVLRAYAARYPDVQLDLQFLDSEAACSAVERGDLELAVVTLPRRDEPGLVTETLWLDPLRFAVAANHPLAHQRTVAPADLQATPAILPAATTFTRRIVAAALRPYGVEPRVALETNYLETIKMMVSVGLGWSVLPQTMLDGDDVQVIDPEGIALERRLGLVRQAGRTLNSAAATFRDEARAHGDAVVQNDPIPNGGG